MTSTAAEILRTAFYTGHDCPCGAPLASDGQGVPWCVRGRSCPATMVVPLPQCDHGLPLGALCADCIEGDSPDVETLARHYVATAPTSDVGRISAELLRQMDEADGRGGAT